MFVEIKKLVSGVTETKTFRQSLITSVATIINGLLGLLFYFILARNLGPANFGVFSVAVTVLTLVGDIAIVGSDTGTVRFVGKYFGRERQKALKFLKLSLETRLASWLVVLSIGWFFTPLVISGFFSKPELVAPIRLALIGVAGYLVFSFSTYALQSIQKYWAWSGLNIGTNMVRLVLLFLLIYFGFLNQTTSLLTYTTVPILGFFAGLFMLPPFLKVKGEGEVAKEFFHYNVWVAIFTLIAAFGGRIDILLSTRFLSLYDLGIYSSAVQLASIVPSIVIALGTVVAPKLAGFDNKLKAIKYLKKVQVFTIFLSALGILAGIPLAKIIITTFYGADYSTAVYPFAVLIIAQAVFLISIPAHTAVLYYFGYPKLFVAISLGNIILTSTLGWYLISHFGFMGASYTVLAGNLFNLLVPGVWVLKKFQKH